MPWYNTVSEINMSYSISFSNSVNEFSTVSMKASRSKLFSAQDPESDAGKSYSSLYALNPTGNNSDNWNTKLSYIGHQSVAFYLEKVADIDHKNYGHRLYINPNSSSVLLTILASTKNMPKLVCRKMPIEGETHTHTATPDEIVSIPTASSKKDYRNNSWQFLLES